MTRIRGCLRHLRGGARGYSVVELLIVLVILTTVLSALTVLFVSASRAEIEMNRQFQAQQDARVAVDRMRREIHCSNGITPVGTSASISVSLPSQCPSAGGSATSVTYDVVGSGQRFKLRRNTVVIADYITAQDAFFYSAPVANTSRGKLRLTLPINLEPSNGAKEWRLVADIVLRNTSRS